jgi:hypothetical protein
MIYSLRKAFAIILASLFVLVAGQVWGATIYLGSCTGADYDISDNACGGGALQSYATMALVNSNLAQGDTVYIRAGTYTTSIAPANIYQGAAGSEANRISYIACDNDPSDDDCSDDGSYNPVTDTSTYETVKVWKTGADTVNVTGSSGNEQKYLTVQGIHLGQPTDDMNWYDCSFGDYVHFIDDKFTIDGDFDDPPTNSELFQVDSCDYGLIQSSRFDGSAKDMASNSYVGSNPYGTATSGTTSDELYDSSATFQTDGVSGTYHYILNNTTGVYHVVSSVSSETHLSLDNIDVTGTGGMHLGDSYSIKECAGGCFFDNINLANYSYWRFIDSYFGNASHDGIGIDVGTASYNIYRGNTIDQRWENGMYVISGPGPTLIEENTYQNAGREQRDNSTGSASGGEFAPALYLRYGGTGDEHYLIRRNVFKRNTCDWAPRWDLGGGGINYTHIYHNTEFNAIRGYDRAIYNGLFWYSDPDHVGFGNSDIRNNIMYRAAKDYNDDKFFRLPDSQNSNTVTYNNIFNTSTAEEALSWDKGAAETIDYYDTNDSEWTYNDELGGDPLFIDDTAYPYDVRLDYDSSMKDAATHIAEIASDSPNIGSSCIPASEDCATIAVGDGYASAFFDGYGFASETADSVCIKLNDSSVDGPILISDVEYDTSYDTIVLNAEPSGPFSDISQCTDVATPYSCCTGSGTGTCGAVWVAVSPNECYYGAGPDLGYSENALDNAPTITVPASPSDIAINVTLTMTRNNQTNQTDYGLDAADHKVCTSGGADCDACSDMGSGSAKKESSPLTHQVSPSLATATTYTYCARTYIDWDVDGVVDDGEAGDWNSYSFTTAGAPAAGEGALYILQDTGTGQIEISPTPP